MHFVRTSTVTGALLFLASMSQAAAINQQLMDCEAQCTQRWSFPAPASSSTFSSTKTKAKTSTHVPSPTPTYSPPPTHTPEQTSTSALAHNAQVKPTSSPQQQAPAPTPSPKPSSSTPAPAPTPEPTQPKPEPAPSSSSPDIAGYLDPHNAARAAHGAAPLTWSDELAAAAQKWANGCVFQHSGGKLGPYGENLAAGSGDYSATSGVKAWVNEASEYSSSSPVPSHFTQVVWKDTTQVGCAVASCNLANFDKQFWPVKFHVCEYSAPGNVIGQFAQNVQG